MILSQKNQQESENEASDCSEDSEQLDEESNAILNEKWADSIAKILRTKKPKKKKTLVLSKAKKLTDAVKKKTENFEIATKDGELKEPQIESEAGIKKKTKKLKQEINLRVKPSILDKITERTLQKIATKGVVQLFNAVKTQQQEISKKLDEAGPLSVRKEKVLKNIDKRKFLDVLMGEKSENLPENSRKNSPKCQENNWEVLREDFQMSARLKDWDKEIEDEEKEMEIESE